MIIKSIDEYLNAPFGINEFAAKEFEKLRMFLLDHSNLEKIIKSHLKQLRSGDEHLSLQTILNGHEYNLDKNVLMDELIESTDLFSTLERQKCSLKLAGLQKTCPEIEELSVEIYKKYQLALFSNMYISPPGNTNCYTYHVDPHKVFFLHIKGQKKWYFPKEKGEYVFFPEVFDVNENQDYIDIEEKVISPGESFSISKGIVHKAEIYSSDVTVHITFPMAQPDSFLLLRSILRSVIKKYENEHHLNSHQLSLEGIKLNLLETLKTLSPAKEQKKFQADYMFRNLYNFKKGRPYGSKAKEEYEKLFFT